MHFSGQALPLTMLIVNCYKPDLVCTQLVLRGFPMIADEEEKLCSAAQL